MFYTCEPFSMTTDRTIAEGKHDEFISIEHLKVSLILFRKNQQEKLSLLKPSSSSLSLFHIVANNKTSQKCQMSSSVPTSKPTSSHQTKAFLLGRLRTTSQDLLSNEKSFLSIPTCFGKIELSGLRCISLLSMFVNIVAFCVLLAILVQVYYLQANHNFLIVENTVDAARFRDIITNSVKTATLYAACLPALNVSILSKSVNTTTAVMTSSLVQTQLANFNRYSNLFPTFLNRVISSLTQDEITLLQLNDTSIYVNSSSIQMESKAASLVSETRSIHRSSQTFTIR